MDNIRTAKSDGTTSHAYMTQGGTVVRETITSGGQTEAQSLTYDGGNSTRYFNVGDLSSWTMTWKNGRELATAGNGTHSVSYDYDVSGLRTYKIVDGVRHDYTYASGLLLRETYTQDGTTYTLDFVYDQSNRPYILNLTATSSADSSMPTASPAPDRGCWGTIWRTAILIELQEDRKCIYSGIMKHCPMGGI